MSNPFAQPEVNSHPVSDAPLATLGQRFGAAMIDGAVRWASYAPGLALLSVAKSDPVDETVQTVGLIMLAAGFLAGAVVQWVLITTTSQSIGKRALNIHIRRRSGARVGFLHGVVLRSWPVTAAGFVCTALTFGLLGSLASLVDALPIFGAERRCMHDYLADTVVNAGPAPT
jgi:uncharacterized RDD family membrane protein YckC